MGILDKWGEVASAVVAIKGDAQLNDTNAQTDDS
jgi:hypothetical protein